mmetsp:Transcript_29060/g.94454  ORF Transcript_29060/g.94454 Transcript_29060/m.94454 type:complete len:231 (-) Transcript_29060:290-982(-)
MRMSGLFVGLFVYPPPIPTFGIALLFPKASGSGTGPSGVARPPPRLRLRRAAALQTRPAECRTRPRQSRQTPPTGLGQRRSQRRARAAARRTRRTRRSRARRSRQRRRSRAACRTRQTSRAGRLGPPPPVAAAQADLLGSFGGFDTPPATGAFAGFDAPATGAYGGFGAPPPAPVSGFGAAPVQSAGFGGFGADAFDTPPAGFEAPPHVGGGGGVAGGPPPTDPFQNLML